MNKCSIANSTWKEGLFDIMRNFLLYAKNSMTDNAHLENVFYFSNKKIVAIDKATYDKSRRLNLQADLKISPYYISQNTFKKILDFVVLNADKFLLRGIRFLDETIHSEEEYEVLCKLIENKKLENLNQTINGILDEYETDISTITFRYLGFDFTLTKHGLLDTDAPSNIFCEFVNDPLINELILGIN